MTTEGEIIEYVRSIDVLMELDTFQGMTDAEIQSLIDYYVDEAKKTAKNELIIDAQFTEERELAAIRKAQAEIASNVLESRLRTEIPWVTVGSDS